MMPVDNSLNLTVNLYWTFYVFITKCLPYTVYMYEKNTKQTVLKLIKFLVFGDDLM